MTTNRRKRLEDIIAKLARTYNRRKLESRPMQSTLDRCRKLSAAYLQSRDTENQ